MNDMIWFDERISDKREFSKVKYVHKNNFLKNHW